MKTLVIALAASAVFAVGAHAQGPAQGPAPAAAAKAKYSTASTPLLDLLKNPETKAIVAKALGGFMDQIEANIDMIPPDFTLEALAEYAGGALSPDALKQIDAEFAKL